MFDPRSHKYPYPIYTDEHYLVVKKNDGTVFDKDYPYIDTRTSFLFKQKLIRLLLYIIVFPATRVRMGLRIIDRKNIRKYKDVIKQGVISVSNHVDLWDYISIMKAIRPHKSNVIVWAPNIRGENGKLMRLVGGIPIPENDFEATRSMNNHIGALLNKGGWLQIYSEGSMWEYYMPIRPFKTGAAYFACKYNKPIIPFGFSYRKPSWFRKHILKQDAALNLKVGTPIYRNPSLSLHEQEIDLTTRVHEAVCRLSDIEPSQNIYPPIFNKNMRIDYYD